MRTIGCQGLSKWHGQRTKVIRGTEGILSAMTAKKRLQPFLLLGGKREARHCAALPHLADHQMPLRNDKL
ncbi:MAG: hypothetical protein C4K60_10590 [Ideonella sp. MAG2]|nr:MAG: hypothetical protein C4K60_10590 [Ideonella sp. MAG2]